MTDPVIRPATLADIQDWYGEYKKTVRAWVIEKDGKPAALAGYSFEDGYIMIFSDMRDHCASKFTVWKYANKVFDEIKSHRLPMIAVAHPDIEGSGRFLERLGFTYSRPSEVGDIYTWQTLE